MAKRVLITGITGQDGSYLAELLLDKGYDVYGMVRRSSAPNLWRIQHLQRGGQALVYGRAILARVHVLFNLTPATPLSGPGLPAAALAIEMKNQIFF